MEDLAELNLSSKRKPPADDFTINLQSSKKLEGVAVEKDCLSERGRFRETGVVLHLDKVFED
jgi:hypothetical protein